jgi:hypothetical protein
MSIDSCNFEFIWWTFCPTVSLLELMLLSFTKITPWYIPTYTSLLIQIYIHYLANIWKGYCLHCSVITAFTFYILKHWLKWKLYINFEVSYITYSSFYLKNIALSQALMVRLMLFQVHRYTYFDSITYLK